MRLALVALSCTSEPKTSWLSSHLQERIVKFLPSVEHFQASTQLALCRLWPPPSSGHKDGLQNYENYLPEKLVTRILILQRTASISPLDFVYFYGRVGSSPKVKFGHDDS